MVEPVLDRDTAGLAGSPDIASSIFGKIGMADIFVADVSIINSDSGGRPTPNPNVLIELGYAVAQLGWDRILLVHNAAFGAPEILPFDIRGRRIVVYEAGESFDRGEVRGLLQGRLEGALRAALSDKTYGPLPSGPEAMTWWGSWSIGGRGANGGNLFIREFSPEGFLFDLDVHNGSHSGDMTAYARLVSRDLAYARLSNGEGEPGGEIVFQRRQEGRRQWIEVQETASCWYFRGARAYFGGIFERVQNPWFTSGLMHEMELSRLYALTGEHFEKILTCTSDVGEADNLDDWGARVIRGGVAGLHSIMESIVMIGERGELCAAYTDEDVVRFFTNLDAGSGQALPKTINEWRQGFEDKSVMIQQAAKPIPGRMT